MLFTDRYEARTNSELPGLDSSYDTIEEIQTLFETQAEKDTRIRTSKYVEEKDSESYLVTFQEISYDSTIRMHKVLDRITGMMITVKSIIKPSYTQKVISSERIVLEDATT
jgi:hypothetical protein